jgi:hypothetical protein
MPELPFQKPELPFQNARTPFSNAKTPFHGRYLSCMLIKSDL